MSSGDRLCSPRGSGFAASPSAASATRRTTSRTRRSWPWMIALPGSARLIPIASLVETLRMVKSPGEIGLIRRSVQTNSEAFAQALALVRPGITEIDLAAELEYRMRRLGAEKPAFESIVAFGPRSAFPHASPTRNRLAKSGLLLIDMGAMREGYASDMTRMAFLGRPSAKIRKLYERGPGGPTRRPRRGSGRRHGGVDRPRRPASPQGPRFGPGVRACHRSRPGAGDP